MSPWYLPLFRTPARSERIYSQWRSTCDAFTTAYIGFCCCVPHAYWLIKASVCAAESSDRLPFSDSISQDPAFSSFPCVATPQHHKAGIPLVLFNTFNSLANEPLQSTQWFFKNWWWATPHIFWNHTFYQGAAIMFFIPLKLSLWLLVPTWWVCGGRTLFLMIWRSYITVTTVAFELTLGRTRVSPLGGFDDAIHWKFHATLITTVLGAIPLRLHAPFTIVEALATSYLPIVSFWSRRPSFLWMAQIMACSVAGVTLGLMIVILEHHILFKLTASWRPEEQQDTTPLGPLCALRSAWAGVKTVWGAVTATQQTVEFAVTAVVAIVCVAVLATYDDLILVL